MKERLNLFTKDNKRRQIGGEDCISTITLHGAITKADEQARQTQPGLHDANPREQQNAKDTQPERQANAVPKESAGPCIVIDERESQEYGKALLARGMEVSRQTLSVADFVLSSRLAVERKSRQDFEASILDGRLFEQAARLTQAYARAAIVVEGTQGDARVRREALLGAYSSLLADFGISLFFTRNLDGTVELLAAMARHEWAEKREMRVVAKPKMLTLSQMQRALVEMLPGMGPKMAKNLLIHFGTVMNVLSASEEKLREVEGLGPKRAKMIRRVLDSVYKLNDGEGEEQVNI